MINMHRQRRRRPWVLVVAALATMFLATNTSTVSAIETKRAISVTLLGDSYTAGNGTGSYYGEEGAFRSELNWGSLYAKWLIGSGVYANVSNFAFSGNTTANVLDKQIGQMSSSSDLVMLTIGGNDVNFVEIVKQCFAIGIRDPWACERNVNAARAGLPKVMGETEKIFARLDDKLIQSAQIVLVGYPLLSEDRNYTLEEYRPGFTGYKRYEAAKAVRDLGAEANRLQADLVARWNATHERKIKFIDNVNQAFSGHEPDPRVGSRNDYRWLNEFTETAGDVGTDGKTSGRPSGEFSEWYHPNIEGHEQIAKILESRIGIPASARDIGTSSENIDIAFAVDTTGSMGDDIDAVKANVEGIVKQVAATSNSARYGLVSYRDHPVDGGEPSDYPSRVETAFTSDTGLFIDKLNALGAEGGGDGPETVYSGAMAALDLEWRSGVRKILIILGDAPAKNPEPVTGLTPSIVATRAFEIDPVVVYAIDSSDLSGGGVDELVAASGGEVLKTSETSDIPAAIASAISDQLVNPFAWIQGPYVAKRGNEIVLDASGSYGVATSLVKFEWDFDGDGTYDAESAAPTIAHIYPVEFDGFVGVRVTDGGGLTATGSTAVLISRDGDSTPDAEDNCPDDVNFGQEDYDQDGTGNVCDPSDGIPTVDKPGVSVVEESEPTPTESPEPTETVLPQPSAAPAGESATPFPSRTSQNSSGLASTGATFDGVWVGAAAVLMLSGAVLLLAIRKRRRT